MEFVSSFKFDGRCHAIEWNDNGKDVFQLLNTSRLILVIVLDGDNDKIYKVADRYFTKTMLKHCLEFVREITNDREIELKKKDFINLPEWKE